MALQDPSLILPATMAGMTYASIPPFSAVTHYPEVENTSVPFFGINATCNLDHRDMDFSEFDYAYRKETWIPITWREILKLIAYIIVFLVSLSGNLLVILVVYYNAHMRSNTNNYLVNLAAADLLVTLVCMWVHIVRHLSHPNYILPAVVCKLDGFVQTTSLLASVLTLTVISVGRVVAVMFPLHARTSPDRAHRVIAAVWITSALLACPSLFYRELYSIKWANFTSWQCDEIWPSERHYDPTQRICVTTYDAKKVFYVALVIALYFLPVAIMFVNYSLVVWRLWVSQLPGEHSAPARHMVTRSKKKVVKMVSVVLIVFVLCWTPLQTIILYNFVHSNQGSLPEWFPVMEFAAYFVAYSNSALNPIIYCGFNNNFRQGLVSLLTCRHASTGRIYHHRWTSRWTVGYDKQDLPGTWKGMTVGTRDTTVGLSGPEPAVLLEFNPLRGSRYQQRCSVTPQSGRMVMTTSAIDLRNSTLADLHSDPSKRRSSRFANRNENHNYAQSVAVSSVFGNENQHQQHQPIESSVAGGVYEQAIPRQNGGRLSTFASTSSFSSDGGTACSCCQRKKKNRRRSVVLGAQDEMYGLNEIKENISNGTSEDML